MKRVVIIDDQCEVLDSLTEAFDSREFKVYSFLEPLLALEQIEEIQPDLLVVDLHMPVLNGVDFILKCQGLRSEPVIVAVTGWDGVEVSSVYKANAHALLRKPTRVHEIVSVFERFKVTRQKVNPQVSSLSRREQEIYTLLTHGYSSKEIAKRCYISSRTVEKHRENIRRRLGERKMVSSRFTAQSFESHGTAAAQVIPSSR